MRTRISGSRRSRSRSRRMVAGMAGMVALTLAASGTSVASGAPNDTEPDADADTDAGVDAAADGVYEQCTENFGLGKVVEIVVEVDGVVPTPPLTFPEDIDIITSWETGGGVQTCVPEPVTPALWESESFWAFLDVPPPVGNYVFLPYDSEDDACGSAHTLTLVGAPAGYTIAVGEAVVPPPALSIECGSEAEAEAVFLDAAAEVTTAPQLAALTNFIGDTDPVEGCTKGDGSGTPSPDLAGAAAALIAALDPAFLALYEDEVIGDTECQAISEAVDVFYYQTLYDLEVDRQAVFELTTPPAPVVIEPTFTG